ncbi:MAG: hypothetical protein AUG09_04550 [Acidobacteria bacterium 13_1_20CM_2_68_7]|nr:MAG: hypothetical protein AUG09_04550 [Acidobacteria bacterium 13_1_20CM_2_68_7]
MQSAFNLKPFLGGRVRIRWIGESWTFTDTTKGTYVEAAGGFSTTANDDGWWLDNINIGGALQQQVLPVVDTRPAPATACPTNSVDFCNENATATDKGTLPQIKATDLNGNIFDGVDNVPDGGQSVRISGVASTLPGGCTNGVPQFQFTKNGNLVQDWSSKTFFQDSPEDTASYTVLVRCSSDPTCTSVTGATVTVPVYDGSDGNILFGTTQSPFNANTGVTYAPPGPAGTTTLSLVSGKPFPIDIYKGSITTLGKFNGGIAIPPPTWQHIPGSICWQNNVGVSPVVLALGQVPDPNPPVGTATFYVANAVPKKKKSGNFGCVNVGECFGAPHAFCNSDAQCAPFIPANGAGPCMNYSQPAAGVLNNVPLGNNYGCPAVPGYKHNATADPAPALVCKP